VEVLLANGTKICAVLDDVSETALTLSYEEKQLVEGKKRKQLVTVTRVYPFAEIKYTKEYIDFK
ncbi:MAG: ribosome assembly cofactor RimP, partial [Alistipes sp.]